MEATTRTALRLSLDPLRSPAWRWERAREIIAVGKHVSRKRDDQDTARAVLFKRSLDRCHSQRQLSRLEKKWPTIFQAFHLAQTDDPKRWRIEAMILAGLSDKEVAARCSIKPETIRWFEAIFFCVRDRLQAPDWIRWVIGISSMNRFDPDNLRRLWLVFGFHSGPPRPRKSHHRIPIVLEAGRTPNDRSLLQGRLQRLLGD